MSNRHPVIECGIQLLKSSGNCLDVGWATGIEQAFEVLDIDLKCPLLLRPLRAIFSSQGKEDKPTERIEPKWYPPSELRADQICVPNLADEPSIPETFSSDVCISNQQDALIALERWGTFVATSADQSIPIYDLFKTAAAIHDCLDKGQGEKQYLLVGCDFSGIQDTVYTITSKGALKTLRARSFMLELLCEHIIHEILVLAKTGRHAVIYSGGGGFGLLLPNNVDNVKKIKGYTRQLNEWALEEFSGRLFIAIDIKQCAIEELCSTEGFSNLRQTQADNLDRLKRHKFVDQLDSLFAPSMPIRLTVATECQITRRDDLPKKKMYDISDPKKYTSMESVPDDEHKAAKYTWVSESCFHQFWLGDKLTGVKRIYRYKSGVNRSKKECFGTLVFPGAGGTQLCYTVENISGVMPDKVWKVNAWDEGDVFLYANYVRKHGDLSEYAKEKERSSNKQEGRESNDVDSASFQGLASSACGADMIGALRMDVDNLGDMFIDIENVKMLSARSRFLNLFFRVYLNRICSERSTETDILKKNADKEKLWGESGRNVSVIYAGGDDLFIVGAWDDTVELAFDIQKEFERYTCGRSRDEGGISGGLTLHQPKYPLYHMARLSAEAEAYAKHDDDGVGKTRKNRISLFYDDEKMRCMKLLSRSTESRYKLSMTWDLGRDLLINVMHEYQKCGKVTGEKSSRRKVFQMNQNSINYQTIEKWFMVLSVYRSRGCLCFAVMARVMSEVETHLGKDGRDIFEKLFSLLYTKPYSEELYMANLHIALNWLSYLRRSK